LTGFADARVQAMNFGLTGRGRTFGDTAPMASGFRPSRILAVYRDFSLVAKNDSGQKRVRSLSASMW
jgi:hypothetical protein